MKRTTTDRMSKAERQLIAWEKGFRKLRNEMVKMIREISPKSRHAVKDMPVSKRDTSLKVKASEITQADVIDAIERFGITRGDSGWNVYPPIETMHPKLWSRVRKVMADNEGDWNTQRQAFVFERDPNPIFAALSKGKIYRSIQERQAFFTMPPLANKVVALADVRGKTVLEPSAGDGHLAGAIQRAGASHVTCFEIDKESYDVLRYKGFSASHCDFLDQAKGIQTYDRVVMNPPFTKKAFVKHILHALGFLKKGGRLVAVIPGDMPPKELTTKLPTWSTWNCLPQGAGQFEDTAIKTSILVINLDQGPAKK